MNDRLPRFVAILFAAIVLAGISGVPVLRGIASFLILEDSLRPAAAIVALGGQTPFREIEAARLYRDGWAPKVVVVREAPTAESEALRELGIKKTQSWELARAVLIQQGVTDAAIVVPEGEAVGTLEGLQAAWGELLRREALGVRREARRGTPETQQTQNANSVSGPPSPKDVRGRALVVRGEGMAAKGEGQRGAVGGRSWVLGIGSLSGPPTSVVRTDARHATNATNAERNNAMDAKNALPVILVTSKYHTRRTRLTWQYVSGGQSQPIVRAASGDPFDPENWWKTRRFALSVVREYLGLFNYWLGFPVGVGSN